MAGFFDDLIPGDKAAASYGLFADLIPKPPPKRSLFAAANDTVIEAANAAAGTVGAVGNFIAPGNRVSKFIDDKIIKAGEESQSDSVKADKARFRDRMESADGIGDELGAVGGYITDAPLQALAQAAGSFALPFGAIKGAGALARAGGASATGVTRAGLAGGVGLGAAGAGGDAAGTAYDLSTKAGATDEEATAAARGASVLPALIGGVGGLVGAERLVAGARGFKGNLLTRALKTGAAEGLQEGVEEGVTQFEGQRAAMPFDSSINPAKGVAGAAAMGAALGAATGGGAALLTRQAAADQGLQDLKAATNADDLVDAALRATNVPLDVPPSSFRSSGVSRDGEILGPDASPRAINERAVDEIRQLDPAMQKEALGLLATAGNPRAAPAVRRFAQNELDALLLPVRQIPVGEVTEDAPLPVPETQELTANEASSQILRPPSFEQQRAMGKRVPTGEATEISPDLVDLETIPVPEVIESGGNLPLPEGMTPRTPRPAEDPPPPKSMDEAAIVKAVVDGFRGTNTPQARAFVQDFTAGRITPADVLKLVGSPPQSPDQRLSAAAAQAPKKTKIQPGDILTVDGQPFGTRSGAYVRAKKEDGSVIEVPGGWAVRPKESANVDQRNVAGIAQQTVAPRDGGGNPAARGSGAVGLVPSAPGRVDQPAVAPEPGNRPDRPVADGNRPDAALNAAAPSVATGVQPSGPGSESTRAVAAAPNLDDRLDNVRAEARKWFNGDAEYGDRDFAAEYSALDNDGSPEFVDAAEIILSDYKAARAKAFEPMRAAGAVSRLGAAERNAQPDTRAVAEREFDKSPERAIQALTTAQQDRIGKTLGVKRGRRSADGYVEALAGGAREDVRRAFLAETQKSVNTQPVVSPEKTPAPASDQQVPREKSRKAIDLQRKADAIDQAILAPPTESDGAATDALKRADAAVDEDTAAEALKFVDKKAAPAPNAATDALTMTAEQIDALAGKTVNINVMVGDTGKTATLTMNAAEAVRDVQTRMDAAKTLRACIK